MDDDILTQVQRAIKAPKDKKNEFGGYNYRNAESILRAFKEIQPEGVSLIMSDSISFIGDRLFLVATAKLVAGLSVVAEAQGVAMHALAKKGMDDAQISGACSSYARKYALCGLFAIDDSSEDPDGKDNRRATEDAAELAHARAVTDAQARIESASDMADLQAVWKSIKPQVQADKAVIAAKEARKAQLSEAA
jgi:hypothetical protein